MNENNNKSIQELSHLLMSFIDQKIKRSFHITIQSDWYAVRSSSNMEDGENDSFAGQFDTFLNVKKEELNNRIIDCFKSLYHESALTYAIEKGIPITSLKMNVIVQKMVNSKYAGVVFTANPQGILNESVIVVGEGLRRKYCF